MHYDVIIVGAGAAGLFCAAQAGQRGRKVLLLDHSKKVGEKIRISGGGRCNFTNKNATPNNYLSDNKHFAVSALKRYTQHDFIALVESYHIAHHEKTLGQLFCDGSAQQIIDMLLNECSKAHVTIQRSTFVDRIQKESNEDLFTLTLGDGQTLSSSSLVVATGGPSIPKMGATSWGYKIAKQFDLKIVPPRAGLVPLLHDEQTLALLKPLAGISVQATATCGSTCFKEALLFTHRGLSGPVILQISSYWHAGMPIIINLAAEHNAFALLKKARESSPKQEIVSVLSQFLPKRLAHHICQTHNYDGRLADQSNAAFMAIAKTIHEWEVTPKGTEGYRTAEVTLGGVDTHEISSKTFETKKVPGLYFIGEVLDVTGHLGGYNFQWAWSSAYAAGQFV